MSDNRTSSATPGKKTLAGVLGSAALAAAVMAGLTTWEGKENRAYRDIVGVVTACRGTTQGVEMGRVYSDAECDRMDEKGAIAHAEGVRKCTPGVAGQQLVAATLLTYNIGVAGYCRSTIARRFNAGDTRGACDAFLRWNRAGGRVIRGLQRRREYERSLCLVGVRA